MRLRLQLRLLLAAGAGVLAIGCRPPSPDEVAKETAAEVTSFARGALSSVRSTNGIEPVSLLVRGFSTASSGQASNTTPTVPEETSLDPQLDEISRFLTERVFTEANVESTEGNATIFRLMGDDLCGAGASSCVEQIDRTEVRIRVVSPGTGAYDFTLLIGPGKSAPLVFRIRKALSLAVEMDLAQAKVAGQHITSVTGQTVNFPQVAEGVVQVMLEKTGAHAYTLSQSVLAAVRGEMEVDGFVYKFSTAVARPLASAHFDGDAKRMALKLDVGETELTVPYGQTASPRVPLTMHGGGASYLLDVRAGQQDFVIADLGLGDVQSWVKYGSDTIFALDLNPSSGRHFDLSLRPDTDGQPIISISPELDLALRLFFSPLASSGTGVVPWLLDDTFTVKFDGTPSFKPVARPGMSTGAVKVLHGTLTLDVQGAGVGPVVVTEGQCLQSSGALPDGGHPLSQFSAGACP